MKRAEQLLSLSLGVRERSGARRHVIGWGGSPRPMIVSPHRVGAGLGVLLFAVAALAASPDEQRVEDTAQLGLAVTLYNEDLALVKDRREVTLQAGENRLAWRSVSSQIRPETALFTESSGQVPVQLLEQSFDFDLLTADSLLKKYVGRTVEVIRTNDAGERSVEQAAVLAANSGVVLRYPDRIETGVVGHLAFPDVPETLRDQPTLVLHLEAIEAGTGMFDLSYLTGGLSWQADYVASLAADGATMDMNGWVTLTNRSGIAYRKAQVQLVAGEVNQVQPAAPQPLMDSRVAMAAEALPTEETLFEYHLYTLPRPTDILDQQTKQVALLTAPGVPVTRELVVKGGSYAYRAPAADGWERLEVEARVRFVNRDGSLGIPLPEGVIRVYTEDGCGQAQFIGEDRIEHTPVNETVSLTLGESFDVTARRKQMAFRKLSGTSAFDYAYEAAFELELKNAKPEPVTVKVLETIPGDWRIIEESQPHTKEAARLASWSVEVPAEGAATLAWVAQIRR